MSNDQTASVTFAMKSNLAEVAEDDLRAMEKLAEEIEKSKIAIMGLTDAKKGFAKDSDTFKKLSNELEAQKGKAGGLAKELYDLGTTYAQVADHKKKVERVKLQEKIAAERKAALEQNSAILRLANSMSQYGKMTQTSAGRSLLFKAAVIGTTAAVLAGTAAFVAGAAAIGWWVPHMADAANELAITRLALTGTAENAYALGTIVDDVSRKVAISRGELTKMGGDLYRLLAGTTVSGQGITDTFEAVAAASSAMGDQVGKQIQDIIERSKRFGRVGIGLFELQGTGIDFNDVAGELAKGMGTSLENARKTLAYGYANINLAAGALKRSLEAKFKDINTARVMTFANSVQRLKDNFVSLASGVNIGPLGMAFRAFVDLFDPATASGQAFKGIVTDIGAVLGKSILAVLPVAIDMIQGFQLGLLDIEIASLKAMIWLKKTFGTFTFGVEWMEAGKIAAYGIAGALGAVAAGATLVAACLAPMWLPIYGGYKAFQAMRKFFDANEWGILARDAVAGLVLGLNPDKAVASVMAMGSAIKEAFKRTLGIHSPSKVFFEFGKNTTAGFAKGVDDGSRDANQSTANMVEKPKAKSNAFGGGNVSISIPITITASAPAASAPSVTSDEFLAKLTKALEDAVSGIGLAT